jgi:protein-S-isoprenylcysteine O-methyltransferase Ste14
MVASDPDAAAVRLPPPLVYAFAIIAGIVLHWFAVPFALGLPLAARIAAAAVSGAGGLALLAAAAGLFKRSGQDPKPWTVTPEIISSGIYGITRNPMYVAMGLLQLSVGIALDNGWILAFLPVVLGIVYVIAIRHEESYLETKFGEAYQSYKSSVRRWI